MNRRGFIKFISAVAIESIGLSWFLRQTVQGSEYPKASWAPASANPRIFSVNPTSGEWYSLVQIHGSNFISVVDRGFEQVRFGAIKATHVPVSRKLMYAYVPAMDAGETSVTVTTQFGVSNAVQFVVKKPWWQF